MAQTVTQILLSQQAFTLVPPPVTVIGSIAGNTLTVTADSPPLPYGVGIRGAGVPAATVVTGSGPVVVGAVAYTVTPPVPAPVQQTTITTVMGAVSSYSVVGSRVAAASYYLGNKALQTVNIKTTNFSGTLLIEASLSTDPSSGVAEPSDWFVVHTVTADAQATSGSAAALASNTNTGVNITGNYVWMRARLVDFSAGVVNWVKLSY